jgi:hypothetical protein
MYQLGKVSNQVENRSVEKYSRQQQILYRYPQSSTRSDSSLGIWAWMQGDIIASSST